MAIYRDEIADLIHIQRLAARKAAAKLREPDLSERNKLVAIVALVRHYTHDPDLTGALTGVDLPNEYE